MSAATGAASCLVQDAGGAPRLVAFNASEAGTDNHINVFEYDEALNLLHRWALLARGLALG